MGKRKLDSELHRIKPDKGTVYQTQKGGNYYFRYWYCNGILDTFGWKFPNAVFSFKPRKSRFASLGVRIPSF